MIKNCPICGKAFDVLYPDIWRYKRNNQFICSWKCIRLYDKEKKEEDNMKKITLEQKKKAVEIAISGGSPLDYLRKCGLIAPEKTWYAIKLRLKETDPELYAKIPDQRKNREKPVDYGQPIPGFGPFDEEPAATLKVDGPLKIETKEPAQVEVLTVGTPVPPPFEYKTTGISTEAGDFQYYRKQGFLDWTTLDGTAVSMSVAEWAALMRVFPEVVRVLGVEM